MGNVKGAHIQREKGRTFKEKGHIQREKDTHL